MRSEGGKGDQNLTGVYLKVGRGATDFHVARAVAVAYAAFVSVTEILEELPRLADAEREAIFRRLIELDVKGVIEESPEMLAAIDAGIRSMETGPGVPLEEVRQRIAGWTSR